MTTLVQIGHGLQPRAAADPEAGTLAQVVLGSGGVKIGVFHGRGRLEGWDEPSRLVFQSAGPAGLWLLADERYARKIATLAPGAGASLPPAEARERQPAAETAAAAAAAGDRVLVQLRNHLTYSGFFFGRVDNPFAGGRPGSLVGFEAAAPLLYWFGDGLVRRLRVTIPRSLPAARAPLGLRRESR